MKCVELMAFDINQEMTFKMEKILIIFNRIREFLTHCSHNIKAYNYVERDIKLN